MKKLIEHVDILTMDSRGHYFADGVILYNGDIIEYVGPKENINYNLQDVERIDGRGMLALPGFINAHSHVAMSLFRGYANDLPLWEWLSEKIWPLESKLTPNDAYWASLLGAAEMISAGVTTFSDMYMFMSETAQAVADCGMRAVLARGLTGPDEMSDSRHSEIEELYKWHNGAEGRIQMMIGPHAIYTCSSDYLKTCKGLAEKYGVGFHIHVSETSKEVDDCVREYGMTPVQYLKSLGIFELPVLAAHCVHLTHEDMDILAAHDVKVVHNPSSNMKLASGFAPVSELLDRGICVALGTDGAASNNNLSIIKEMSLAALISKGHTGDPKALPARTVLEMGTIQGARALMLQDKIGSLEQGKKADIQLINTNQPHYYPKGDAIVNLVYSGHSQDVNTVIINGKIVMKDRNLTTINLSKVYEEVEKIAKRILA